MSWSDQFEDTDRRELVGTIDKTVTSTVARLPSRLSLIASGVLVVIFAIQFVGVLIGQLPIDGSGSNSLAFGIVIAGGLASSILAFVSLYRRARRARRNDVSRADPHP